VFTSVQKLCYHSLFTEDNTLLYKDKKLIEKKRKCNSIICFITSYFIIVVVFVITANRQTVLTNIFVTWRGKKSHNVIFVKY